MGKNGQKYTFRDVEELDPFAIGGRSGIYLLHDGTIYRLDDKPFYRSYKGDIYVSVSEVPLKLADYQRISPIDLCQFLGGAITFRKRVSHTKSYEGEEGESITHLNLFLGRCEKTG